MLSTDETELFNRAKAIRCFGSLKMVAQLLTLFLLQVDVRLAKLREALDDGDIGEVEDGMHWLRGGLSYMFSPAAERVCFRLDQEIAEGLSVEVRQTLCEVEAVISRLQRYVSVLAGDERCAQLAS